MLNFHKVKRIGKVDLSILFVCCCIAGKLALSFVLPDKFLYDSGNILSAVMNTNRVLDSSYMFAVNFYRFFFNIFGLQNTYSWSLFWGLVFDFSIFIYINKFFPNTIPFTYAVLFLLFSTLWNIYTFLMSKDLIIFLLIAISLGLISKSNNRFPFIFISLIISFVGYYFKSYYFFILAIFLLLSLLAKVLIIRKSNKLKSVNIWLFLLLSTALFFVFVVAIRFISRTNYLSIINARENVNLSRIGSVDAQSMINDLFSNSSSAGALLNIFVALLRIVFPIELVFKGNALYIAFFVLQVLIDLYLIFLMKMSISCNSKKFLLFSILIISYLLVSSTFEPDFGSFLRHEVSFVGPVLISSASMINKLKLKNKKDCALLLLGLSNASLA